MHNKSISFNCFFNQLFILFEKLPYNSRYSLVQFAHCNLFDFLFLLWVFEKYWSDHKVASSNNKDVVKGGISLKYWPTHVYTVVVLKPWTYLQLSIQHQHSPKILLFVYPNFLKLWFFSVNQFTSSNNVSFIVKIVSHKWRNTTSRKQNIGKAVSPTESVAHSFFKRVKIFPRLSTAVIEVDCQRFCFKLGVDTHVRLRE